VSFAAITLCIASQRVFIVVSVYFVIDSVRKLLDTPSYNVKVLGHTQPPIQWIPRAKRPGRETDHSTLSSAQVKSAFSCALTPPVVFMA
jgi:hypothetical protein